MEVLTMAKEPMVYQANPLIEGRREFSLIETRLFYLGLKGVVPKLTNKDTVWTAKEAYERDFPVTIIPTNELISLFGNDKYYSTLSEICDKLAKKTVKVKGIGKNGKEKFAIYPVFAELSYNSTDGLKIEFNSKMKPWLLDLADKPFTKLPFEQIWGLGSSYSIRLFELLLQYKNTKTRERVLTIEELRACLGIADGAYGGRTNNFRRFIVDASVRAINQATAYKIDYEPVKDGRRIVAFKFKLHVPAEVAKERIKKNLGNIGDIVASVAGNLSMAGKPSDPSESQGLSEETRAKIAQLNKKLKGELAEERVNRTGIRPHG